MEAPVSAAWPPHPACSALRNQLRHLLGSLRILAVRSNYRPFALPTQSARCPTWDERRDGEPR
eukprot:4539733-Prorocentrum_lima.AAC.1